jgi:hypothetical protein
LAYQKNSDAHSLLQLLVSRAVLEGVVGEACINIPLSDMMDPYEGLKFTEDAADVVLKVRIITEWEDADDVEEIIEMNLDEGEDDYEDSGEEKRPGSKPSKNKKSH